MEATLAFEQSPGQDYLEDRVQERGGLNWVSILETFAVREREIQSQ